MSGERVPIPKLKRDWKGRYVRLTKEAIRHDGAIFAIGTIMRVDHNYNGLHLETTDNCSECQRRYRVQIIVPEHHAELLPEDYKPEWSATVVLNPTRLAAFELVARDEDVFAPVRDIMRDILKEVRR